MDIWEVLQWNSIVCNKDIDPELSEIESIIKAELEEKDIQFEIMQSNRVMMKLDISSGHSYVLWDRSYWEVYYLYLFGIINIAKDKGQEGRVRLKFKNKDYLSASIFLFLALRIHDADLSKKFAYAYCQEMSGVGAIMLNMSLKSIIEDCEVAQFFVAMHEKSHYLLNENSILGLLMKKMDENIQIAKSIISNMPLSSVETYYGMTKGQMLRFINRFIEDETLKTDLLCDASAFNECLVMFFRKWENKYSREKIINKCIEAIRIHGFFSSLMNALDTFWNDRSVTINTIQENLLQRIRRYDVSELVFMIQLSSYIFDMNEAMKPDNFYELDQKNSIIQKVICRFINEDIRDAWVKYDFDISTKDKYELLKWRI